MKSLDPRVARFDISSAEKAPEVDDGGFWTTYEVFHQAKRGKRHEHVGTVHAPDKELAMILAKEQFARRQTCVNLWVVKTSDVLISDYEDADIFANNAEKIHREAAGYKVRDRIEAYKKRKQNS